MRKYKTGKSYELEYVRTKEIHNRKYLCVTDGEFEYTVVPYDFQLDWPDQIPDNLLCYVKAVALDGRPRFTLDRYAILKNRYPQTGINCSFYITDAVADQNGTITGYILSDAYGITHYVPAHLLPDNSAASDNVILYVKDIAYNCDNRSKLLLLPEQVSDNPQKHIATPENMHDLDTVDYEESDKVEFKTSIVYLSTSSYPDIDGQCKVIMQTIAGFMNNEGGKLLIGVNDNGEVVGIQNDIEYLFPNGTDDLHNEYKSIIQKRIISCIGRIPDTKLNIEFIAGKKSNLEYVLIDVGKMENPVFVDGTELFVRAGNVTVHLKDHLIVSFIAKRMGLSKNIQPAPTMMSTVDEDIPDTSSECLTTDIDEDIKTDNLKQNREKKHLIRVHNLAYEKEIIGHLYFLKSGACRFVTKSRENKPDGIPDFIFKAPVPRSPKNFNFLIFYSNGDTDIINLETALYGTGRNRNRRRAGDINPGWNTEKIILDALCIKKTPKKPDLIAYISELSGRRYIKLHNMSAIAVRPHRAFGNRGNRMLAEGAELKYIVIVSGDAETRRILAQGALICPDSYKQHCGTPVDRISGQYREILKPLLEKFEDVPDVMTNPVMPKNDSARQRLSTYLYILSNNNTSEVNVEKTLFAKEGFSVANIQFKYDSLKDLCDRHFPELKDKRLTFVKFTCPDKIFNKEHLIDIFRYVCSFHRRFLTFGNVYDYKRLDVASIAGKLEISEDTVKNLISDGYIVTENAQYPLYDAEDKDISMVV